MRKAFSLIEVLIFVAILSVFLVTSASIITVSLHQNSQQINKLKATHYNEQLLEWVRSEKETDWNSFVTRATDLPSGSVYCFCFETLTWATVVVQNNKAYCCPAALSGIFKRSLVLSSSTYSPTGFTPSAQVQVSITTDWQEGDSTFSTTLHTLFTPWEE